MTCEACGRPFEARRPDHRYCSPSCRSRGLARRRADRLRAVLAGLDAARAVLAEELARWETAAAEVGAP